MIPPSTQCKAPAGCCVGGTAVKVKTEVQIPTGKVQRQCAESNVVTHPRTRLVRGVDVEEGEVY
jgi:hypothetical protein